jgi:hypothetical protein
MEIRKAQRKKAFIKMGLQGPSGSGKSYGALLLAYGLTGKWDQIAVIDTENGSSDLYAHLGDYNVLQIAAPFTPEKYAEAIEKCCLCGFKVIIIDSISHEWDGSGGILDIHSSMTGNSFTNWSKLTPRHNDFVSTILQSQVHIICTIRSKQDYVLNEKNGKQVPEKIGLKGITREGMDYEFTLLFDLDIKHNASGSKDRTGLFLGKPEFKITAETGMKILNWCNAGEPDAFDKRINDCASLEELLLLYQNNTQYHGKYQTQFATKKQDLLRTNLKQHQNGNSHK